MRETFDAVGCSLEDEIRELAREYYYVHLDEKLSIPKKRFLRPAKCFDTSPCAETLGQRKLFVAIIAQALLDELFFCYAKQYGIRLQEPTIAPQLARKAQAWLLSLNESKFSCRWMCDMLGINAGSIRIFVRQFPSMDRGEQRIALYRLQSAFTGAHMVHGQGLKFTPDLEEEILFEGFAAELEEFHRARA